MCSSSRMTGASISAPRSARSSRAPTGPQTAPSSAPKSPRRNGGADSAQAAAAVLAEPLDAPGGALETRAPRTALVFVDALLEPRERAGEVERGLRPLAGRHGRELTFEIARGGLRRQGGPDRP